LAPHHALRLSETAVIPTATRVTLSAAQMLKAAAYMGIGVLLVVWAILYYHSSMAFILYY
jgi:hypothetical protein